MSARGVGLEPPVVDSLLGIGLVATDDPGDRTLQGRTGEVRPR